MTDPTPQTTPTRDEAVEAMARVIYESTEAILRPNFWDGWTLTDFAEVDEHTRNVHHAMARAVLASAPAPASGGVDAVREAAERVRMSRRRHSGTYESSPFEFYPVQEVDALLHAIDLGGKLECEECSGAGHTGIEGNDVYDCPACNGEGSLSPAATQAPAADPNVEKLLTAAKAAKRYLEPDLVEPGRTVFWNLVSAIKAMEGKP